MSMSVRPVADGTLRPLRLLALAVAVLGTVLATAARADSLRSAVRFDEKDVLVSGSVDASRVEMKGLIAVGVDGEPQLPMAVEVFHVPAGFRVADVRVTPVEEIRIAEGVRLSLRQAILDMEDPTSARRPFPTGSLAGGAVYPSRSGVALGEGEMGGYSLHSVGVFPVRWDSSTNELLFARTMDVQVELVPDVSRSSGLVRERPSPQAEYAFAEAVRAIVANPADVVLPDVPAADGAAFTPRDLPSTEGSGVDMVIITSPGLETNFQVLADWKTRKGVPTVIRTTDWINTNYPAGVDQPSRIRMFLRDAYQKWGTYLLLVGGDYTNVAPRSAHNRFFFGGTDIPTDQYYACLDGEWNGDGDHLFGEGLFQGSNNDMADLYPDLFVGRACVETPTEVQTFVNKSLQYEKNPPAGYVKKVCYLAEVLFPDDWQYGEDPPEVITLDGATLTEGFDAIIPGSWARTKNYQTSNTLSRDVALNALNAGHHHLMTLMNHGDAFKFSVGNGVNPLIFTADTQSLTNGNYLMFVMATACNPNQIDLECQGESFMNNANGGAICVLGPTREDFPLAASDYHEELLRTIFVSGLTQFGAASQVHRVPFVPLSQTDSTPDRWTMMTKMLLGDPEIRFWTEEPVALVAAHAANLPLGTGSVTVTVTDGTNPVPNAVVCASDANGTYARARTNTAGQVTLPLSSSEPGTVDVVATAKNFLPSETTMTLDAIAGAQVALTDFVVDEDGSGASSGNGDGVIDAGETVELNLTAHNGGGATANGVTVNASIEAGSEATFNLLWGGVADTTRIYIGPDRVHPASVPFTLDFASPSAEYIGTPTMTFGFHDGVADQGIFVWQDQEGWHLRWGSGDSTVQVTGSVVTDGRVRGFATPLMSDGIDSVTLSATEDTLFVNGTTGLTDLTDGVDFALADDTWITVTTPSDALGNIAAAASAGGTVVFSVDNAARARQIAYLDLDFSSTSLQTWSSELAVTFAGPSLEAYMFVIEDGAVPPVSGNGNGVVEVGETVRLTPTVLNRGDGHAGAVAGSAAASSGITFVDASDAYGDLAALGQSTGADGFVFTVNDGSGTSLDLTLTDDLGRTWVKTMDFVAPVAPANLRFRSTTAAITPEWDRNAEPDLAGYNVYRSATSGSGHTRQNFELVREAMLYEDSGLSFGSRFWYYVTAVDSSGNEGPASSEIEAWTTQVQLPGWPRSATSNVFSSIAIGDADGIPGREVFVGSQDHKFYGWNADGSTHGSFPVATLAEIWGTPALADLDEDGDLEVLGGSNDSRFYVLNDDGSSFYANPYVVDLIGTGALMRGAPCVADVDQDSELEYFFGTDNGRVYAFKADGTGYTNPSGLFYGPVLGSTFGPLIWGPIACADWDGDGQRELAFACRNDSLYVVDNQGNNIAGFPRKHVGAHFNGPVFADLDNDGTMELMVGTEAGNVYIYNHDGTGYLGGNPIFTTLPKAVRSLPAPCNLDADPQLEIVITCMDGDCYAFNHDGTGFLNPGGLFVHIPEVGSLDDDAISTSPIVVDVDGDGDFEIFFGHRNFSFYGFHHDGGTILGMPIPTSAPLFSTAAAGDLDNDGDVEIVFASYDSFVSVLDFDGASTPAAYEWPSFAGGPTRRSVYGEIGPYQTGVEPGQGASVLAFALAQNSPNPFVQGTRIGWSVPRDMNVSLRIFNIEGRLVRELVNGPVTAGAGSVAWDGRDSGGAKLSSGIYFYQLQGPDDTVTRKSVLLR
jgi:hypothetical protein